MPSTLTPEIKSKEACRVCGQHKLYTNDSEKDDFVVRWHCLNCNHTYSETAEQKEFYKKKDKEQKRKENPSNSSGLMIFVLLLMTILTVLLTQEQATQEASPPAAQIEQTN